MKLPSSVNIKYSNKLFHNKYKYKIVLRTGVASWFRGGKLNFVLKSLSNKHHFPVYSKEEHIFAQTVYDTVVVMEGLLTRVESPFLSFYTNNESDLKLIAAINHERIKYISMPDPETSEIAVGSILVKKLDFGFKITMGSARQNLSSFVQWSKDNPKVRLPKRAAHDLSKDYSHGGSHFYVKDEKSLILVKMFLGSYITKIETVIRS